MEQSLASEYPFPPAAETQMFVEFFERLGMDEYMITKVKTEGLPKLILTGDTLLKFIFEDLYPSIDTRFTYALRYKNSTIFSWKSLEEYQKRKQLSLLDPEFDFLIKKIVNLPQDENR